MKIRKPRRRVLRAYKVRVDLIGGPFHGHSVYLGPDDMTSVTQTSTLPIAPIGGFPAGRYIGGRWSEL